MSKKITFSTQEEKDEAIEAQKAKEATFVSPLAELEAAEIVPE